MRLKDLKNDTLSDQAALSYPEYLLSVDDGRLRGDGNKHTDPPSHLTIISNSDDLISSVFPNLKKNSNIEWLTSRVILTSTN